MLRILLGLCFLVCFCTAFSQTVFTSSATGGAWNLGTTWDQTGCTSGCVAGVDYPAAVSETLTVDLDGLANQLDESGQIFIYSLGRDVVWEQTFGPF